MMTHFTRCPAPWLYEWVASVGGAYTIKEETMKPIPLVVVGAVVIIAACAPKPESIQGTYTSSALYQNLSCEQLVTEAQTISNRAHESAGLEKRHRVEDTVAVAAGVVIFWPALFFTHGADATAAQVAQLKGEMEAIERAANAKNCGIVFNKV